MYDYGTQQFIVTDPILWIDLGVSAVLLALMFYVFSKSYKSKLTIINEVILFLITIAAWIFSLKLLWGICLSIITTVTVLFFVQNPKEIKSSFSNIFSNKKKIVAERIYDREEVCKKVTAAIENLSKTKTGALISFERHYKFDEIVKSGTLINSPISPELIATIFYPGTRLHDGAVVIRRDEILAASVYYTPTTKPLTGKYGSRHRAAIGISEVTDAVTVVVSEETGRISIAYKGELIPIMPDKFEETLLSYLMSEE